MTVWTEELWSKSCRGRPMLRFLAGQAAKRKLLLHACSNCRLLGGFLTSTGMEAITNVENYAEDEFTDAQMCRIHSRHPNFQRLVTPETSGAAAAAEALDWLVRHWRTQSGLWCKIFPRR